MLYKTDKNSIQNCNYRFQNVCYTITDNALDVVLPTTFASHQLLKARIGNFHRIYRKATWAKVGFRFGVKELIRAYLFIKTQFIAMSIAWESLSDNYDISIFTSKDSTYPSCLLICYQHSLLVALVDKYMYKNTIPRSTSCSKNYLLPCYPKVER